MLTLIPSDVQRIIVAPLNWGLGHATRCIPIIRQLIAAGKEVSIASDGSALEYLQREFPLLSFYDLPPYKVSYDSDKLWRILLSNSSNVLGAIYKEKKVAETIIKETNAEMIISDSRFGFRSKSIRSVIISHQLNPLANNQMLQKVIEIGNRRLLNAFDECWVPDDPENTLSGKLSKNKKISNVKFIGPRSRLVPNAPAKHIYDICIILSGPEPARTVLETKIISLIGHSRKQIALIRGTKDAETIELSENVTVIPFANSSQVSELIQKSTHIISRSGYTSLMDYHAMDRGAWLIPTPGQSEQEYLAEYMDGKYGHRHITDITVLKQLFD